MFVFMFALLCFCVATEFLVNKDLYNGMGRNSDNAVGTLFLNGSVNIARSIKVSHEISLCDRRVTAVA